ncbi:MAG TPA: UvrD-helicase domain-containing protein [Bryobacteraceae bacterium]|nr:UvrD-helicase domain-containing protein [Bryobacteraceae bacterium]
MLLSPEQLAAVERTNQDVCVVAGPGSGKTRVLIERFAWLVNFHNISPGRILAITFTEKAATEIKERLIEEFKDTPEHREAIERAWVSTIDGFCARLLQENAIAAGIAPDFSVLDQPTAARLARDSAEEALDGLFLERPAEMRRLMEALDLSTDDDFPRKPDLAQSILAVYESMRIAGLDELPPARPAPDVWPEARRLAGEILADRAPWKTHTEIARAWAEKFLALPGLFVERTHFEVAASFTAHLNKLGNGAVHRAAKALKEELLPALSAQFIEIFHAGLPDLLREAVARLDKTYRKKKRALSAVDFADLEEESIRLLERGYFIRQATRARFDQILMDELQDTNRLQWRLLDLIRNEGDFFAVGDVNQSIYGFRHADPEVFRSYRDGLEASGAIIDDLRENHRSRQSILDAVSKVLDGQPGIEPRPLIAARTFGPQFGPSVERLFGETAEVEASLVASRIRELVSRGEWAYKDIAILVRTLNALEPFVQALDRFDIPFITSSGQTFYEAREVKDLLQLLAALVNPLDEIALIGVLRSPMIGLSDEEILRIGRPGWQEVFEAKFGNRRKLAGFLSPDLLLDDPGYLATLNARARANVEKLFSWLRQEHRARPRPLAEMLDDLELLRKAKSEGEAPPPESGDVVQLMSIHAAKGLEFKIVFVSALQREGDKSTPVIAFSAEAGLGAKWRNPATGKSLPDAAYRILKTERKQREDAEENRLLYVAMTRAEERLFLTYTKTKNARGWVKLVEPAVAASSSAGAPVAAPETMRPAAVSQQQFVDPPVLTGQHDSSAAVTDVALFDVCPRKYFLERYVGVAADPDAPGKGATNLGTEVHKILAGGTSAMPEAHELAARASKLENATREFDFLYAIDDVVLRGQIDVFHEKDGKLIVGDYKTGKEESPEEYALQLRIYALALERYLGRLPDRAVLFYLRSGNEVEIPLSDLDSTKKAIARFLDAQRTMRFELREGDRCRRCAFYKGLCPAGKR